MPGVFPDLESGGLVVRDADGNCLNPPNVSNAYCPPPGFITSCEITALPADCNGRLTAAQINAVVSELLSFAECLDPDGSWNCNSVQNLCNAFSAWATLNVNAPVIISDTAPTSVRPGLLWWESDTGNTYIWYDDGDSAQWVMIAPGSGYTGITQGEADLRYLQLIGGTMTGNIILPAGAPVDDNQAVTKAYVDAQAFGGLPVGGTVGQALVINSVGDPQWGVPIDCGTY